MRVHLVKRDVELVEERALDRPDDVGEPLDVLREVLDAIREQDGDLFGLNAVTREQIPLHSID